MFNLFLATAHAQGSAATTQAAAAMPAQSPMASLVPWIMIMMVFYFLIFRPQKKKLANEQSFLTKLAKGDEIYTKSGIIGVVAGITDRVITLEVAAGVKIKVLKSQVSDSTKKIFEPKEKK